MLAENSSIHILIGKENWSLPNHLLAFWYVNGFDLDPIMDIYTSEGLCRYIGWILCHYGGLQRDYQYLDKQLTKSGFFEMLKGSILTEPSVNLPALFYFVYWFRPDLREGFQLKSPVGIVNYLKWIRSSGYTFLRDAGVFEKFSSVYSFETFCEDNRSVFSPLEPAESWRFDEAGYLQTYPDVLESVNKGYLRSAKQHWFMLGAREGRQFPWLFNAEQAVHVSFRS